MLEKEAQNDFDVTEFEQYIDSLLEIRRSHDLEGDRRIEEIRKLLEDRTLNTPIVQITTLKIHGFEFDNYNEVEEVEDGDYISDLKWLRSQESRWHELETKKFKKLPQLSSQKLERFLKEKDLDTRTKRLIKQQL
jgi:hypothetical protein